MHYTALAQFGKSKYGKSLAFMWGLAEGLLFFVVPDVYLSFIALFSVTGGLVSVAYALLGSLCSAVIVYALAPFMGGMYHTILLAIPGISEAMLRTVTTGLAQHGVQNIIAGPFSGIPYKIYSVEAALQHLPIGSFLLWSIPARLERMLPVTLVALVLGYVFQKNIKKYTTYWILGFLLVWALIYIQYYYSLGQ